MRPQAIQARVLRLLRQKLPRSGSPEDPPTALLLPPCVQSNGSSCASGPSPRFQAEQPSWRPIPATAAHPCAPSPSSLWWVVKVAAAPALVGPRGKRTALPCPCAPPGLVRGPYDLTRALRPVHRFWRPPPWRPPPARPPPPPPPPPPGAPAACIRPRVRHGLCVWGGVMPWWAVACKCSKHSCRSDRSLVWRPRCRARRRRRLAALEASTQAPARNVTTRGVTDCLFEDIENALTASSRVPLCSVLLRQYRLRRPVHRCRSSVRRESPLLVLHHATR